MGAFQSPNYTQTPNDFFAMLPDMSDAELRATLVMIRQTFGFHREGFKMGVSKLASAAGLSRQGALDGAKTAEQRGTFRRTNPEAITEAEWELVIALQPVDPSTELTPPLQPVEGSPQVGGGQVGIKESSKENKTKDFPLDWKLGHNQEVTQQDLDEAKLKDEAPKMFEKAFGFGKLPWHSNNEWTRFAKFVMDIYRQDRFAFGKYVTWRKDAGKFQAMNNKQIRMNPKVFMDTGWMEFVSLTIAREQVDREDDRFGPLIRMLEEQKGQK